MKVGAGIQAIFRVCFNNLTGFSVGIFDGRCAIKIASGGILYTQCLMMIG
jgi:hypothetical protein